MDGFHGGDGVIVVAATNRPETLDKAITRPGRFDRIIQIQLPDVRGREDILRATVKRRQVPLGTDVDLHLLARSTPGFSGAELVNLLNEAAHEAARNDRAEVMQTDFDAARDRILLGSKNARIMSPEELKVVAVHEAGHALVSHHLRGTDPIYKVTIVARGDALGMVARIPERDRFLHSRQGLVAMIAVALAGRLAEEKAFGPDGTTTGANDDLKQATRLATRMVTDWGFVDAGGMKEANGWCRYRTYEEGEGGLGPDAKRTVAQEVAKIIEEGRSVAQGILDGHAEDHARLVKELLERETLTLVDLNGILGPSKSLARSASLAA